VDGDYEIRTITQCTPAGLDPPEGINQAYSTILKGRIDRVAPTIFSDVAEPADGIFSAGDTIGVEFTEDIMCSQPYSFTATMAIGTSLTLSANKIDVICEGRMVRLSVHNRVSAAALNGKSATVTLAGLTDMALNPVTSDVSWTFEFESDESVVAQPVLVANILFNIAWDAEYADNTSVVYLNLTSTLIQEIAIAIGVSASSLSVDSLHESEASTLYVDLLLLPETETARRATGLTPDEMVFLLQEILTGGSNSSLLSQVADDVELVPEVQAAVGTTSTASPTTTTTQIADAGLSEGSKRDTSFSLGDGVLVVLFCFQAAVVCWLIWRTRFRPETMMRMWQDAAKKQSEPQHQTRETNLKGSRRRSSGTYALASRVGAQRSVVEEVEYFDDKRDQPEYLDLEDPEYQMATARRCSEGGISMVDI
jgi:hypothetical protein